MVSSVIINLVMFIVSCFILVKCSGFLVKALIKIATFLKVNEFSVGFIIMAVSTSLPELFVGAVSAFDGTPIFALGTVIGSNILNMTIVIGVVAVLSRGIKIRSSVIKKDILYMMGIAFMPVFLMVDNKIWQFFGLFPNMENGLSRFDGFVLLVIFGLYIWNLLRQEKIFRKTMGKTSKKELMKYVGLFVLSFIGLLGSAHLVVHFAKELSYGLGVPEMLIGLFLIALGTSLPELMFETKAVMSRHQDMAIGDLIGSVIANSTLVLGVTAIIAPIGGELIVFFTSTVFMLLIAFIFSTFAESENGISWREGMSLLLLYVFFVIIETYIKSM